jgi:hypothetical protein
MTENTLASLSGGPASPAQTLRATCPLATPSTPVLAPANRRGKGLPTDPELLAQARALGQETARRNREAWAKLTLRQTWADETHMKGYLRRAGVWIANMQEPATEPRLRQVLRRAGVSGAEIVKSVGLSPEGFNSANPNLPLWAAVALVLESTGRFQPQGTRAEHSH